MDSNSPRTPATPGATGRATPGPTGDSGTTGATGKIQHSRPGFSGRQTPASEEPLPVVESVGPAGAAKKITAIEKERLHEEKWTRTPNTTGQGAIHVRSFHSKLTDEALVYMDQCINEWLDAHPQYEVKLVSSTVGILTGKLKEPHLVCQVWV